MPLNGLTAIGKSAAALSGRASERFEAAAFAIAERFVAKRETCTPAASTCFSEFVDQAGRQIWRRPLHPDEVGRYVSVAEAVSSLTDPETGLVYVTSGLLQSPHFLYRVELGESDPEVDGRRRLNDFELATRLSFFLTAAPPDAELSASADEGTLRQDLEMHAERLLASDRATGTAEFFLEPLVNSFSSTRTTSCHPSFVR